MWRQVDGHRLRVDDPSQNELDSGPRAIAVPQLLERDWLSAKRAVRRIEGAEDVVDGVQEETSDSAAAPPALGERDEVVDEHVYVLRGASVGRKGRVARRKGIGIGRVMVLAEG